MTKLNPRQSITPARLTILTSPHGVKSTPQGYVPTCACGYEGAPRDRLSRALADVKRHRRGHQHRQAVRLFHLGRAA